MNLLIYFLFLAPALLLAEDGKVLYARYCSACHGVDGVGPKNNVNPPLAGSEWILGDPDRAIAAVMVGLTGPIEVSGKAYHLVMPPQGAVLNDVQLAAILSHVRSSWGNQETSVKPSEVARVREKLVGRSRPYGANELRLEYPIPFPRGFPRVENLISKIYHGKWETMPDFSELEMVSVEEEVRNLVDVAHAGREREFGIVWEGELVIQREGDYRAMLDASDGAILSINGKKVMEVEGVGARGSERARQQRLRLLKGRHEFRLEYFHSQGSPGLSLKMAGPGGGQWLSESRLAIRPRAPVITLRPGEGKEAVIYRNFIDGAEARAIGVGYEGGVNQAFSVTHLGPDVIWQGDFLDAGLHWTNRGRGKQKPLGEDVVKLLNEGAYFFRSHEGGDGKLEEIEAQFGGYLLNDKGLPTFHYRLNGVKVTEEFYPENRESGRCLVRVISFESGESDLENLCLILFSGPQVEVVKEGFLLDGKVVLGSESKMILEKLPKSRVFVPLTLEKGRSQIRVQYCWETL